MDSTMYAMNVLKKQLQEISMNDDIGVSVGLENADDMFIWDIIFEGPNDTLFEVSSHVCLLVQGGFFKAKLIFPHDYPNNPPEMRFLSNMWHPNIYSDGRVCISILHPPGVDQFNSMETADERWRPILGVESIIISVISMLNDPNIESPANLDAAVSIKTSLMLQL